MSGPIPFDSIHRIVEYLWAVEAHHFEEMLRAGEVIPDDENHLFTHLRRVDAWLSSTAEGGGSR